MESSKERAFNILTILNLLDPLKNPITPERLLTLEIFFENMEKNEDQKKMPHVRHLKLLTNPLE